MQLKRNKLKTGILISMLIVPVLLFLFFYTLGDNEYNLPVYFATDSTKKGPGYEITEAETIPDFTLINQDGDTVRGRDFKGQIYIVDFFFTRCPDICPVMSNEISRVQEEMKNDKQFRILSVTVDPKNDTLSVLKKYAQEYRAIKGKWDFTTGVPDSIYNLAQKHFKLTAMNGGSPGSINHSDKIVLVDKDGWIRGYYSGTNPKDVERLITEINVLKDYYARHQRK